MAGFGAYVDVQQESRSAGIKVSSDEGGDTKTIAESFTFKIDHRKSFTPIDCAVTFTHDRLK